MMEEDHVSAWMALAHWQHPKDTQTRLAAMIDDGAKRYTPWGVEAMWHALRQGECFEPVCVDKALAALEVQEQKPAAKKGKAEKDTENELITEALQEYLAAAKVHREYAKPAKSSAAEYRQWFKEHPPKVEKEKE
jgi:hypothetical protein